MTATRRYFALFGPKLSGKTVYLGALYGSGGDAAEGGPAYHVAASEDTDDPTHAYLGNVFRALRIGKWPDSTAFERLERMTFRFTSGDQAREVVVPDVGGELTQRAVDAADRERLASELKEKILTEYAGYHGFMIFVPADPVESSRASEYKWEVDALLNALRERTPDGGMIDRPFAVLVTKWDFVEPGPLTEESEARAAVYLGDTHPELASGLKILCQNLRVFPVSATGPTVAGFPPVPLRPMNLGAPVAWLVETSECVMLDRAIAYVERNREGLFRRDPDAIDRRTCLEVAHGRLADFLKDVPHGPLADEARDCVQELRGLSRNRLKRRAVVAATMFGLLILAALGYRDNIAYNQASALLENAQPELPPRDVIARVSTVARESFLIRPVGYSLLWWPRLRGDLGTYRNAYESRCFEGLAQRSQPTDEKDARDLLGKIDEFERDFSDSPRFTEIAGLRKTAEEVVRIGAENRRREEIEQDYKKLPTEDYELAKKLLAKCESFLKDLPASGHAASIQALRAEVQAIVRTQEEARDYAALQVNLNKAANAPLRCHELCAEFLKNDPSHPKADELHQSLDRYLRQADDQSWDRVKAFAREYPGLFRKQIAEADAYLANALYKLHRDDASQFKAVAINGYERSTYDAICRVARDGNDAKTLLTVLKLCKDYLNDPISGKTMATDVEHWVQWFDEWTAGKELHVRVATIRIDRGSSWHHWLSFNDPWVRAIVKVGPKSDYTSSKSIPLGRDIRDLPDDLLGPFTWRWGDPDVSVTLHHKGASLEDLTETFGDGDPFKVRHLNGLTTFDGGKIAVRLECPEIDPPVLPSYKKD